MDTLPNFDPKAIQESFKKEENEIFQSLASEYEAYTKTTLESVKNSLSDKAQKTIGDFSKSFKLDMKSKMQHLLTIFQNTLRSDRTAKLLDNLKIKFNQIEKLIFLIRLFNCDNTDQYQKMVISKGPKMNQILFDFNNHLEWWVKTFTQTSELDPKQLLAVLSDSMNQDSGLPLGILTSRLPNKDEEEPLGIKNLTHVDYYYIRDTLNLIQNILNEFSTKDIEIKINDVIKRLTEEDRTEQTPPESIENNPIIKRLILELENLEKAKKDNKNLVKFLFESKQELDDLLKKVTDFEKQAISSAKSHISGIINKTAEGHSSDIIPIQKFDDLIAHEIATYSFLSNRRSFIKFIDDYQIQLSQECVKIISSEKFLVQSAYIPIYFEEKFVVFQQGKGDFNKENFPKLITDFCNLATKEYKKVEIKKEQKFHPIYFCYVSENKHDFYLVEYDPYSPVLRIFYTSAPMQSTLYRHLAKLDFQKIEKKNVQIITLNYFDPELSLEFRNVFLDPKLPDGDDYSNEEVSEKFRYFVFITMFLLKNSATPQDQFEIKFHASDFIQFFNYMADYQGIYLRNQNQKEPIPSYFEPCYPFVDLRRPKQSFLVFSEKDEGKGKSLISVKISCIKDPSHHQYEEIDIKDPNIEEDAIDTEIMKFLKKHETKPNFNFDGPSYLNLYIKRKRMIEGFVKFIDKKQGQALHDIWSSEHDTKKSSRLFDDSTKFSRIFVMFPCIPESKFLLMITFCRKEKKIIVYTFSSNTISFLKEQNPENDEDLKSFIFFLAENFRFDKEKVRLEFIKCKCNDEMVLHYFKRHYFPFTHLIRSASSESVQEITSKDFILPFREFLNINIGENNLDMFKAYGLIFENMLKPRWKILNIQSLWKYTELKFAIESILERAIEENQQNILIAFNFMGIQGRRVYYIYFKQLPKEESKSQDNQPENSYSLDLFTLSHNLEQDDTEVYAHVLHQCITSSRPSLLFNKAFRIRTRNNTLFYNQVEITLTSLCYLVSRCNLTIDKAFQKLCSSVVNHYEILEDLMDQAKALNESETKKGLENGKNIQTHSTFFEQGLDEFAFQKKLENEVIPLLDRAKTASHQAQDLFSFVTVLNCEDKHPAAYTYVVDEDVIKRVLNNENNFILDNKIYQMMLEDVASSKTRYEEALNFIFPENQIFFILPYALVESHQILLVKYVLNKRLCVYYFLKGEKVPKLNENLLQFIQKLDEKYLEIIKHGEEVKFEFLPFEVELSPEIKQATPQNYDLIIKSLLHLFSKQITHKDDKMEIDVNTFNSFLAEYSEDLFGVFLDKSPVKQHYRFLSNLFLQPNSVITKKICLLTFLNGTASIEQMNIVNSCIKSFKNDFKKILNIENAFFCFNVGVKANTKHFLLHLYGKEKKNMSLKIFTNSVGDSDSILDKMIQTYSIENESKDEGAEEIIINQISMYKINIPNRIFTKHLEISSFLMAHSVCNDLRDSSEVCALLALSPMHYLNELKSFEEKCRGLDLFKNMK